MKKLLLGSVALFALNVGSPAVAADMPVKYKAPPPVYTWTGCYGGGFVGYSAGKARVDYGANVLGIVPGTEATNGEIHLSGATGGFDLGCQYQAGWWLIGVEVDAAAINKDGQDIETLFPAFRLQVHETWLATARIRLGYAADKWLFYVTGGGAWARFDVSNWVPGSAINTHDVRRVGGWTAGAGWEYALGYGWSLKSEFLYVDFGTKTYLSPADPISGAAYDVRVREYIYRVGLNYKFDWYTPVVAKY